MSDDWYDEPARWEPCDCGGGYYNAAHYRTCYGCFLKRSGEYTTCIYCGRWHSPEYSTCYTCSRPGSRRAEAARNLRLYILWRDDYQCQLCGARCDLQVDHIKPCRAGGEAVPWNLQVLCRECNWRKGPTWFVGGHWWRRRRELLVQYFYWWRTFLDADQREALRRDVDLQRRGAWA